MIFHDQNGYDFITGILYLSSYYLQLPEICLRPQTKFKLVLLFISINMTNIKSLTSFL